MSAEIEKEIQIEIAHVLFIDIVATRSFRSHAITGKHCDASDDCREREQRCRRGRPAHSRSVLLQGLELFRQLRIAHLIRVKIYNGHTHSMLHFAFAEIMQERPPMFTPRQNPFYCALPYNDKAATGHRPEAPRVVPWFKEGYQGLGVSTCKDRWVAIRKGNRTVYAQWEDAGPFRTDYWQYVFGNERPKPNLNKGAGLDVSPAVRDYLGLNGTDLTDWRFVEFNEVSRGPWSTLGENNTFVISDRKTGRELAEASKR